MRKILLFILIATNITSCVLFNQNNTKPEVYTASIEFQGFVPENHQEVLELIRGDILISKILDDSIRIAEDALKNSDCNFQSGLAWGSPDYEKYMEAVKKVRSDLVGYIRDHRQQVIGIVKTRGVDESLPEDEQFFCQLILKHVSRRNMEIPMLTQLELISQGPDYYAYRFKLLNDHEFDIVSFSTYYPWYRVKFIFDEGYLDDYDYF